VKVGGCVATGGGVFVGDGTDVKVGGCVAVGGGVFVASGILV